MSPAGQAPRFRGGGRIEFEKRPVPQPGAGQLLVRVRANAICGTDREPYHSGSAVIPGHETAGEVIAVGIDTSTPVGTAGVVFLMDYCSRCRSCQLGHTNQCLAKRADMGFTADGGYGPYELVHETNFFPVPDLPFVEATLLLDVMGTSSHAIGRAQHARSDIESIGIAGAGPIGLGLAAMCRLILGESIPVLVADVNEYRLALAERLGAIAVHAPEDTLAAAARREGLDGVDAAFDSTGRQVARQGLLDALTSRRGVLVCVGHGEGLQIDVSSQLIAPERSILGSEYFRYSELAANLRRLRAHRPYLTQILTHRFPVERIDEAFATFLAGDTGKVVVEQEPT
ncbi:MAG: alcohol dehydrogenase catalytic domain-containing protein [Actinomycetota bacterium]|nr:alcohol dehydrogenase catalytic domain-containing protein [Actinomycetota bacterium]